MNVVYKSHRIIIAVLSVLSMIGSGTGIGVVFAGFLISYSRNPKEEAKLFSYNFLSFIFIQAVIVTYLIMN